MYALAYLTTRGYESIVCIVIDLVREHFSRVYCVRPNPAQALCVRYGSEIGLWPSYLYI